MKNEQYQAAVDSYSAAIRLNPGEARYWQLRGRLRYALWLRTPPVVENDHYLYNAWQDIDRANLLDPTDTENLRYQEVLTGAIIDLVGEEAWNRYLERYRADETIEMVPADFGCAFNTRFIADVTIPDDTILSPGESFEKIWRIRNSGTCPWEPGTLWQFVAGDRMDAPAVVPLPPAVRGDEVDVAVTFTAPEVGGTYRSDWALAPPDGPPLDKSYYVQIVVPEGQWELGGDSIQG